MDERFRYLLDRFIKKQISDEEKAELRFLLGDSHYEQILKEDLSGFLANDFERPDEGGEEIDYDQLYQRIQTGIQPAMPARPFFRNTGFRTRVAAVLLLTAGIGYIWTISRPGQATDPETTASAEKTIIFRSKDFIHLPDGSTVLLNENSELSYTEPFGKNLREVMLKGEAYFDIQPDSAHAFIVHTGDINTRVLGTSFNVNAREKQVVVTVTRGLVEVGDQTRTYDRIRPNERIVVDALGKVFEKTGLKSMKAIQWKDENLIFDGITLREAAEKIEGKFNVRLTIENPQIKNCRISAWFLNNESLPEILDLVCGIRQASYVLENGHVRISDGIGCETDR